jgi:hypothetical protein
MPLCRVTAENYHSKIVATEIIDDILKGAVKTDNNSTKRNIQSQKKLLSLTKF